MPRAATIALLTALAAPVVGAWSNAEATEDRYGPPPAEAAASAAVPAYGLLSWSTKAVESRPSPAPAPAVARPSRPDRVATAALPTSLYSSYPSMNPRAATHPAEAPWTPPARAAAPVAPAPVAVASANQAPRFYSVHREFGLQPDPIPLSPQFFSDAPSADLAAPPPPLPPHPIAGSQAATSSANTPANRARAVESETADSAVN